VTKTLIILQLLAGDPIHAVVDPKVCLTIRESFNAGHQIEIFDDQGDTAKISGIECAEVQCVEPGCI
jgi:hypothetical protein